jgi:hypothetical protein
MDVMVNFTYKGSVYQTEIYFSFEELPCYLFCFLRDPDLIREFGEDLSIKTDCEQILPMKVDYRDLSELKRCIFGAVCKTPEFMAMRKAIQRL